MTDLVTNNGRHPVAPRCAALVGPYLSGKTTLLEALLFACGVTSRRGSVKEGNLIGDATPEARARQMSTELNTATAQYLGDSWTFLDCPGSVDLIFEAQNALLAADVAVVVCEPDPDRVLTLGPLFKFLDDHKIPHMVFINKMDTASSRVRDVLAALQGVSQQPLVLRQVPLRGGAEGEITGYVDLVSERAYKYKPGQPSDLVKLPDGFWDAERPTRTGLLEKLADYDDKLLEQLLEDVEPSKEEIYRHLADDLSRDLIVPVFLGAAQQDHGVRRLLKALRHETPAPSVVAARLGVPEGSETVAQIIKTYHAPHSGKLSLARIWRGSVAEGAVLNGVRVAGLLRLTGATQEKLVSAGEGEIVALSRMEGIVTGDVLTAGGKTPVLPKPSRPKPVFGLAIAAEKRNDDVKLSAVIAKLIEEDPTIALEHNQDTGEMVLWGQGDIHLQITLDRMRTKYNLAVLGRRPHVPYKETIKRRGEQHSRFKRQSGGHGQFADVEIQVKPLPRGGGLAFTDSVVGGAIGGWRRGDGISQARAARLPRRRCRRQPLDRPVPRRRQLRHGLQDGRPHGDERGHAEMRPGAARADPRRRYLGAQRLHLQGAAPGLRPARPDPRLRRQGGLVGLGRRHRLYAAIGDPRPHRRAALDHPRGRPLQRSLRPSPGADRQARRARVVGARGAGGAIDPFAQASRPS